MLDLDALLQPISDEAPSGEDLEYDDVFTALEIASRPGEERVIGDAVIPAEEPDYDEVIDLAPSLLSRSMDVRPAVLLADAVLRRNGLPEFANVLEYVRRILEEHWDTAHPQLDEDDGDPTMRVNAVLGLTNRETVLSSLRRAALVNSRGFGAFSLRDIELAAGEAQPSDDAETISAMQTISAAFQDADAEVLADTLQAASAALDHIKAISAVFEDHVGMEGPDLTPLEKMVYDIQRRMSGFVGEEVEAPAPEAPVAAAPAPVAGQPLGAINTPNDVKQALEKIIDYYARCEPSSPLPILLERAKRLVSADFVTIMKDMAPQGIENVALIGGFPAEEEDY